MLLPAFLSKLYRDGISSSDVLWSSLAASTYPAPGVFYVYLRRCYAGKDPVHARPPLCHMGREMVTSSRHDTEYCNEMCLAAAQVLNADPGRVTVWSLINQPLHYWGT